jgi:sugar transferase (PEP-CTERM/EpsH1 system associated)
MRLLWISHLLPYPPKGGVTQRSHNLIKEASKQADIYLFSLNQRAWLPTKSEINEAITELRKFCMEVKVFSLLSDKSKLDWYRLLTSSFFSFTPYSVNWVQATEMKKSINAFLNTYEIDVIHCDTIGLDEYVTAFEDIPKVLNHHNIESHMMIRRSTKEKNLLKRLYFYLEGKKLRNYEKRICPFFNANLVVSELDRKRLEVISPDLNIYVVPNGVDISYFKSQNSIVKRHSLIFTGSMDWYPNIDATEYFIRDIWPLLRKEVPDVIFTIAGRSPTNRIKKIASGDSSINVTGYVEDIRPYIDESDIYICPIRDGGGTKLKILDAMSMKKAIVATSVAVEGLDVIHGRHILIADDPKTFVSEILHLLNNSDLKEKLGQNARQFVEKKYSWEIIGREMIDVYRSLGKSNKCVE